MAVDPVAMAIATAEARATRLPIRVPLSTGRIAVVDVPSDATDQELADLAFVLLGPIRSQCAGNRTDSGHPRILRP